MPAYPQRQLKTEMVQADDLGLFLLLQVLLDAHNVDAENDDMCGRDPPTPVFEEVD